MQEAKTITYAEAVKLVHPDLNPDVKNSGEKISKLKMHRLDSEMLYKLLIQWKIIADDTQEETRDDQVSKDLERIKQENEEYLRSFHEFHPGAWSGKRYYDPSEDIAEKKKEEEKRIQENKEKQKKAQEKASRLYKYLTTVLSKDCQTGKYTYYTDPVDQIKRELDSSFFDYSTLQYIAKKMNHNLKDFLAYEETHFERKKP